jgi:hypothetical protein
LYDATIQDEDKLKKDAEWTLFDNMIKKHRIQPLEWNPYMCHEQIRLTPAGIIQFYCFNEFNKKKLPSSTLVLWFCYQVMKIVPFLGTGDMYTCYGRLVVKRDRKEKQKLALQLQRQEADGMI